MKDYKPIEELCDAIILQAVEDYRDALSGKTVGRRSPEIVIRECEKFFLSDWFEALTTMEGESLMESIRERVYKQKIKEETK